MIKILTICGSMKFWQEMIKQAERLELEEKITVFLPTPTINLAHTGTNKKILSKLHRQKIDLSDGIFVVNKNGYIGQSTKAEIAYAKKHNKAVLYLESLPEKQR